MLHAVGLLQGLSTIALLPMTSNIKKKPIWLLWNLSSSGKATSESPSLLFFSFIITLFYTVYCLASHSLLPPCYCSVFCLSLCSCLLSLYFNSDFVLFFLLLFLSPLPFPVPRFLSLGEFWITEAFWCQAATILHVNKKDGWKRSGSCTGTFFFQLVCHA